jgi:hypothetical protein
MIDHSVVSIPISEFGNQSGQVIQVLEACISRHVKKQEKVQRWDEFLPWIMMGYRITPQEPSGLIPFEIMYAAPPLLPANVQEQLGTPLSYVKVKAASKLLLLRAHVVSRSCIMAGNNASIAVH